MNTITVKCDFCGKLFNKTVKEYNRNQKLGRRHFCSRSCSAKSKKGTDFKYIIRNSKRRCKEFNITSDYLQELWDKQQGICPYTGLNLVIPTYQNVNSIDITIKASLDRIDSSKGYIIGNVQFVSYPINLMKTTMSDIDTKKYLKSISSYTSCFHEDETISSHAFDVSGAQAGN